MTESEWKLFSRLAPVALERYCERTLAEFQYVITDPEQTAHERYRALYKLLLERDSDLAAAFNGRSRSNALEKLMFMNHLKLLTDEELAQFREETRAVLRNVKNGL